MAILRSQHLAHLILLTLTILYFHPVSASVFGQERPPSLTVARNLQPAKRQSASNGGTSQRLGRRSKKSTSSTKAKKDYSGFLCTAGTVACPVLKDGVRGLDGRELKALNQREMEGQLNSLADWFRIGFECVDVATELGNCGGCTAMGNGHNCALIPNAIRTECEQSSCKVYQCIEGFTVSTDKQSCISRPGPGSGGFQLDDVEEEMILLPRH